jgi:prepilin-type N-terminal cleavage/methylation domain-containing protein
MKPTSKMKKGFTMIEVLVAIFIISVGVLGVVKGIPKIMTTGSLNASRLVAAYLAQEGIEIARGIRDGNMIEAYQGAFVSWDDGLAGCANGCRADYTALGASAPVLSTATSTFLKIDSSGLYNYTSGTNTNYQRQIKITEAGSIMTVTVTVYWQERGKAYSFPVQEKIYNWQ